VRAAPGANNPEGLGLANYETLEQDAKGAALGPVADSSWLIVTPWGFRKALAYLNDRYNPGDMAVTENGVSVPHEDSLPFPAVLNDQFRIDFYDSYLKAASDAVREDGVPLTTYFAWSLLDNFECECCFV
jgi:beta-glucosidase